MTNPRVFRGLLGLKIFARRFSSWRLQESGAVGTASYRIYLQQRTQRISPWHHIPLVAPSPNATKLFHFVNEIPKGSRAKMEIATKEKDNPIKQDVKKGQLRFFKAGDIPFNYGALPQTFEDPEYTHPDTKFKGDNDPVDVVEISGTPIAPGAVLPVKVLGALAMIDDGETDWKIIAIALNDPSAASLTDISSVPSATLHAVREWFRNYKIPDGKPPNQFALNEQFMNQAYACDVIEETHQSWKKLVSGQLDPKGLWIPPTPTN
eukprot:TRINITY_DN4494_c0_g1_i1.p1 TRINITY_DN4494_c0_g1~~TRINITY_DN4494_c0_g1_i1.p1  ORF type:complete len:264 (-),score=47.93 TRINITY_DN4494_c0_g1_i1:135-926(-)